jgi:S-DNA-T family DNA segregation ATPase FtsK/SpoIIIE
MSSYSKIIKKRKKAKKRSILPESVNIFIARNIINIIGFTLIAAGIGVLLALSSYTHTDPSWNSVTTQSGNEIYNIIGLPGSYISDFLLQTVGLGGVLLGIILTVWGLRVYKRQSIRPIIIRSLTALISILMASAAFAKLPSGDWLLYPWLGGSFGTIILDNLSKPLIFTDNAHTTAAIFSLLVCLICFIKALAISKTEIALFINFVFNKIKIVTISCFKVAEFIYEWVIHYGNQPQDKKGKINKKFKFDFKFLKRKKLKINQTKTRQEPSLNNEAAPSETIENIAEPLIAKKEPIQVIAPKQPTITKPQKSFALDHSGEWELPTLDLLQEPPAEDINSQLDESSLRQNAEMLQNVLSDFKVQGDIVSIHPGPVVTLYEFEPAPGVKAARIIGLSDDIARSMAAISVRCSIIPGRNVIGIELPNSKRQFVHFRNLLENKETAVSKTKLPLVLGKDISGKPVIGDLAKMPHLLVAGTTGSGKSVAINTMILSLLYRLPPEKCRFIMIDPKMLELSVYDDIPHLLSPVVTEPGKAVMALKWLIQEMEERYRSMSKLNVRNIEGYNARMKQAQEKGETLMRKVQTGFDPETGKPVYEDQPIDTTELPYIVVVIDEFADLMIVAKKDIESAVQRLAQMARAAGIHLIMATQRPSTDVITGVIKANFPTRISFQVTSIHDSRTILGETGAEQLLGMGDMLYMPPGDRPIRVHGPFVSDEDVENVVNVLKAQGEPSYLSDVTEGGDFGDSAIMNAMFGSGSSGGEKVDDLYDEAVALVARERKASTSFIQRCLQIGYNRAARIIEEMEKQGVVSPATATGKRDVLVGDYTDA